MLEDLDGTDKRLVLTDDQWNKIADLIAALEPIKKSTKVFQTEQLLPGDFYGSLLRCRIALGKLKSPVSEELLSAIKVRETILLESDAFLAAIYMDPRYSQNLFKNDQAASTSQEPSKETQARKKVLHLWTHYRQLEKNPKRTKQVLRNLNPERL